MRIIAESRVYKQLKALSKEHWSFRLRKTVVMSLIAIIFLALVWIQQSMQVHHHNVEHHQPPTPCYKSTVASVPPYRLYNASSPQQYQICALTRVRNIADIMAQWIEYHNLLGIDQFYIMDDCSADEGRTAGLLGLYESFGLVRSFKRDVCNPHVPDEKAILKMLFNEAKPYCQWVAVFDVDEYIILDDAIRYDYSLPAFLQENGSPVMRLMWWVVGSDGHETRPDGLMIENYKIGRLDSNLHVKSMARTDVVEEWAFAHHPTKFIDSVPHVMDGQPLLSGFNNINATKTIIDDQGRTCLLPESPVYIKHYVYRSYQEFMQTRGTRKKTNSNIPNPWSANPRSHWLKGNFTDGCQISMDFNEAMADKVHQRLDQRIRSGKKLVQQLFDVGKMKSI